MIITFECDAYEIEERIEELNELGGGNYFPSGRRLCLMLC